MLRKKREPKQQDEAISETEIPQRDELRTILGEILSRSKQFLPMATFLHGYYENLQRAGFTKEEAMPLVMQMQRSFLLPRRPDAGDNPKHGDR